MSKLLSLICYFQDQKLNYDLTFEDCIKTWLPFWNIDDDKSRNRQFLNSSLSLYYDLKTLVVQSNLENTHNVLYDNWVQFTNIQ
jgi:hypothetical protein